jgi:hypothetical protein
MRWDDLFGDLEAQWESEERRDLDAEVADRTRRERAALGLYERLSGAGGVSVTFLLVTRARLHGVIADVGQDWVLVEGGPPALVPFSGIVAITGLSGRASVDGTGKRFGFGYALRGLSRDRAVVALTDVTGALTTGTIDAVGSDAIDLSEHAADLPRRPENLTGSRLVPFSAIACLRPA